MNARAYYAICDKLIQGALRDHSAFSVLFIDLDHFKKINDQYGHEAGDTVLKVIARCLGEQIRGSDYLGRVGGEEFSVFLPHTSFEQAMVVAEKIRAAVEAAMPDIGSQRLRTTASIGVASRQTHHSTMKSIQAEADHAMYAAKKAGRNRVSALSV